MRRAPLPWRRFAADSGSADPCLFAQRRWQTFQRHRDSKGDTFYTVLRKSKRGDENSQPKVRAQFEISNLLLDLDAEGSKGVRPIEEEDEQRALAKWSGTKREEKARRRLDDLRQVARDSKAKMEAVATQPTNVHRLAPSDLLSAAMRGSQPGANTGITEKLCAENGIPKHAMQDNAKLLTYMEKCWARVETAKRDYDEAPPSVNEFVAAVEGQESIIGLQRLTTQCINQGFDLSAFADPATTDSSMPLATVSSQLIKACKVLLERRSATTATLACIEILIFIGNLIQRVSGSDMAPSRELIAFSLSLSLRSGNLSAIRRYLSESQGYATVNGTIVLTDDVLQAMDDFLARVNTKAGEDGAGTDGSQGLAAVLEGILDVMPTPKAAKLKEGSAASQEDVERYTGIHRKYVVLKEQLQGRARQ